MAKSSKKEIPTNKYNYTILGDPECKICHGLGYVRIDVPVGHPDFGKVRPCICRKEEILDAVERRLFSFSNLNALAHLTFESFNPDGKQGISSLDSASVRRAYEAAQEFASKLDGWLLIEGKFGCGKTHLAAAIGNQVVKEQTLETIFITTPDLLDVLRFAYSDPEESFEERYEHIRKVPLLILDDFGTHNATQWAQEKLFQIINYRYINQLPLVITTNLPLDDIESRIRSRLQDERLVTHVNITAPDYRLPNNEISTPGLSVLHLYPNATFGNFNSREADEGKEIKRTIIEYDNQPGQFPEKKVVATYITKEDIKTLKDALGASIAYAEDPSGWLVVLGPHGCGKTHLAAAIGNYRVSVGSQPALMVSVISLLDYLRETFSPDARISYGRRFEEIKKAPLLILDGLGTENPTDWAREKLFQLLDYRYVTKLPTVITSAKTLDELEMADERILNRLLDENLCQVVGIEMPKYFGIGVKRSGKRK
jgi:DNA replication protein DnaC